MSAGVDRDCEFLMLSFCGAICACYNLRVAIYFVQGVRCNLRGAPHGLQSPRRRVRGVDFADSILRFSRCVRRAALSSSLARLGSARARRRGRPHCVGERQAASLRELAALERAREGSRVVSAAISE